MVEAYPGAVYRHRGAPYRVREWARRRNGRQPFIRADRMKGRTVNTRPILCRTAVLPRDPGCVIGRRALANGHVAEMKVLVTESAEGYEDEDGVILYRHVELRDPRLSRKQREMPTTALWLRISEPWFTGDSGEPWQARSQVARALRLHLAYQESIALPDLGFQVENVFMETPAGYAELNDSIVIHDNIHGGMGLVQGLYRNIDRYAGNLKPGTDGEPSTVYPEYVRELVRWLEREEAEGREPPGPGPDDWWRAVRSGSRVRVFSKARNAVAEGVVEKRGWRDGIYYLVDVGGGERVETGDRGLTPAGNALDWELWQPSTGRVRELQLVR